MVGRVRQPKPAARFEVIKAAIGGPAPRIGEHTREVLRDLGYDDGAIEKMIGEHAVREPPAEATGPARRSELMRRFGARPA